MISTETREKTHTHTQSQTIQVRAHKRNFVALLAMTLGAVQARRTMATSRSLSHRASAYSFFFATFVCVCVCVSRLFFPTLAHIVEAWKCDVA